MKTKRKRYPLDPLETLSSILSTEIQIFGSEFSNGTKRNMPLIIKHLLDKLLNLVLNEWLDPEYILEAFINVNNR